MKLKNKKLAGILVLIMGIAFMGIGASRGEVEIVLMKAIRICLECIGIG